MTPEFTFKESKIVAPGKGITKPVETPIGQIGMQICYDIRFPESAIWLKKQGAQIVTYPSAFSVSTGAAHWDILNRSRAIENQCFVVSAAQQGNHNAKRASYGQALIVSPWGEVIVRCTEELEVQFAEIDLERIAKIESNMPCFSHRRDDVYSITMKTANQLEPTIAAPFMFEKFPIDPETIFYETELCVAFTNIRCVVPGHVLVATKRCVPRVEQMTTAEIHDLFVSVCKISKVLDEHHGAKSTTITVQDGEFAGQTGECLSIALSRKYFNFFVIPVKHIHCHIMPRKPGDFKHNDEIYLRLAEHDVKEMLESTKRPLQKMIDEAQAYKRLLD